jgi:hypothetical protein
VAEGRGEAAGFVITPRIKSLTGALGQDVGTRARPKATGTLMGYDQMSIREWRPRLFHGAAKMPAVIIAIVLAIIVGGAAALAATRAVASKPPHRLTPQERAEVYAKLRKQALRMTPRLLGIKTTPDGVQPYGILMETGYPEAVATLTSFSSGDASLYFSKGGGVIGGIGHEPVRAAARQFVASSHDFLPAMVKTTAYPLPVVGQTRFYILTTKGIYTAEASETDLGMRQSKLSPLFYRGQAVITELRLIVEKRRG